MEDFYRRVKVKDMVEYDLFEQIQEERDSIMLASLFDIPKDYSKLRELCYQMNEVSDARFAVDGSDEELWQSVVAFYQQILK